MSTGRHYLFIAFLGLFSLLSATSPSRCVNPFIGTGGHGHTFPGAAWPHGMVQASPDTRIDGWDGCSGYHYSDTTINGLSQTHLSGTGCADYGDFLLMPVTLSGDAATWLSRQCITDTAWSTRRGWASTFDHADEKASPGYYSVALQRYNIGAEVTATPRGAMYRLTYPDDEEAAIILDLDYSVQHQYNLAMEAEQTSPTTLEAWKNSYYWAANQPVYLALETSQPFKLDIYRDTVSRPDGQPEPRCRTLLRFGKADRPVLVKLAISSVDVQGARGNLAADLANWDFDAQRDKATEAWDEYLGKIELLRAGERDQETFYTALYHTGLSPYLQSDADGRYRGMDDSIRVAAEPVYTVFSLWDTHRALHPLYTLIDPENNGAFIRSLLRKAHEGGALPMWELASNYTATMTGFHGVSLMADALSKGQCYFDVSEAYAIARRASSGDTTGMHRLPNVRRVLNTDAKHAKDSLGWIPWDLQWESVAQGLEYAYDDWCVAQLARAAGDDTGYERYFRLGKNYRNYFDPATRFMRGRDAQGRWHVPFNPYGSQHRGDDYCEGTAWQWSWFAPHDIPGLIELYGGREAMAARLDSLFLAPPTLEGEDVSPDIAGLIGQYAHGNEPSHHILHLYNYLGHPERTQRLVGRVMREQYRAEPDGLSGNEDCGQMSAWYVLNALGLYQVCPGEPVWSLGRPWQPQAVVHLPQGHRLQIIAHDYAEGNDYVSRVTFNGATLREPFLSHEKLAQGGTLEFFMTSQPCEH